MIVGNSVWFTAMQVLIPDNVRARVGAYDWFVSLVIMPVGWVVMGPLSASIGFALLRDRLVEGARREPGRPGGPGGD